MIDSPELNSYVTRVVSNSAPRNAHITLNRFMCRCLAAVRTALPAVGQDALDKACAFWMDGNGDAEELTDARVACWGYLDSKGSGVVVQDKEDAAIRAVICVLYPEPESEDFSVEAIFWFADMFDRLDRRVVMLLLLDTQACGSVVGCSLRS